MTAAYPDGFCWGVSTAAYQVEGAEAEDGRGPSSWDIFAAQSGHIKDGSTGGGLVDQYHRYPEDVALMRDLGIDAYRFSISWSRVLPTGEGAINQAGLGYYDRLIDSLLGAGVRPAPTLFHWDTPQALEEQGGWQNRDITGKFADYCGLMAEHFADRVPRWITINEPRELTMLGYGLGVHAPGQQGLFEALPVAHHLLLGHGLAVQALRAAGAGQIGIAASHSPIWAASDSAADLEAAAMYDDLMNWTFADALLRGEYPELTTALLPPGASADLPTIATPLDWYGINYYNPERVGAPAPGQESFAGMALPPDVPFALLPIDGCPQTAFGWPVVPDGLRALLQTFRERYGDQLPPIMITENGCSTDDRPDASGAVDDQARIDYLDGHLAAVRDSIADGVDVRGYFVWSLIDNFEWAEGYSQRFGLVRLDPETGDRRPKASYNWLRDHIGASRR